VEEKKPNLVYQKNKKSGVVYVYEDRPYWNPDIKQSRSKRTCIGKIDPLTGDIVPTRGRRKSKPHVPEEETALETSLLGTVSRKFYGATYLLDSIGAKLGIVDDLKFCFPNDYEQLLSLIYYLIMEDKNPLFRFEKWGAIHKHPYGKDISSQRSSELLASITPDTQAEFFRRQGKRRIEKEYWAYDTTTIYSYSETLLQVQQGKYKGGKNLPQLKLLLVFGEDSRLPFYYRKLAGNTPDSKTVKNYLAELDVLGLNKTKVVMDRGFFSETNINGLYKEHIKFLIGAKISAKVVRQALDGVYDDIRSFDHYSPKHDVYGYTVLSEWDYEEERPYKGDVLKEKRRIYIHLYYNIGKAAEDERKMDLFLATLQDELLSDKLQESHKKYYEKYFDVKKTPKRGIRVTSKDDAIKEAKRYYGFFALVSNDKMDALDALEVYRARDVVEKAFGNLKDRLNFDRTFVSSEQTLDGKMFIEFIALIYLSYINRCMQDQSLYRKYSMEQMFDKLDIIECFEYLGKKMRVGEVLEKQHDLFVALGVEPLVAG
jgi:transposase